MISMPACGKKDKEASSTSLANPMHESDADEFAIIAGQDTMLPVGSEDVSYFTIDTSHKIYEARFTLDGAQWRYRVSDENELTDTSGMYYDWKNTGNGSVEGRDATVSWNDGETGIIYWYDVVPGLNYSLSVDTGASFDKLTDMANNIFVCVQGDA